MPFYGLLIFIQVGLVIHVIKTGRDSKWVWVLMVLPGVGALAYLLLELAPDLLATRSGRNAASQVKSTLNPNKELNDASLEYERSPTVANSTRLAESYIEKGRFEEASELYNKSLTGINEFDPELLYGLAQSEFGQEHFAKTRNVLDTLIEKNPSYKNQDAHLLYARNLQQLGETTKAIEEYETLVSYYTGPEPAYRYGLLLKAQGEHDKAQAMFQSIRQNVKLSPKHYKSLHKQWIDLANKEIE